MLDVLAILCGSAAIFAALELYLRHRSARRPAQTNYKLQADELAIIWSTHNKKKQEGK